MTINISYICVCLSVTTVYSKTNVFLNQVRAAHAWFLEIVFVGMSVCVAPEAIDNQWHDMVLYRTCVIG